MGHFLPREDQLCGCLGNDVQNSHPGRSRAMLKCPARDQVVHRIFEVSRRCVGDKPVMTMGPERKGVLRFVVCDPKKKRSPPTEMPTAFYDSTGKSELSIWRETLFGPQNSSVAQHTILSRQYHEVLIYCIYQPLYQACNALFNSFSSATVRYANLSPAFPMRTIRQTFPYAQPKPDSFP